MSHTHPITQFISETEKNPKRKQRNRVKEEKISLLKMRPREREIKLLRIA